MARARNIKPSFFKNEILGQEDPMISLLYISLWTLADKAGRLMDIPIRIKAETFPYRENLDVNGYLTVLSRLGFIRRYEVDGFKVIQILTFEKHQNPHHTEKPSELPEYSIELDGCGLTVKEPLNNGYTPADSIKDSIKDSNIGGSKKATAFDISKIILPSFIDQESWSSYVEMRKVKKKAIATERTCNLIIKDLTLWNEKGLNPNEALDKSTKNGWTDVYEPKVTAGQAHNVNDHSDGPVEQVNIADLPKAQKLADTTNAVDQSENKTRMQEALRKSGVLNG